jgi:hypothetical protein
MSVKVAALGGTPSSIVESARKAVQLSLRKPCSANEVLADRVRRRMEEEVHGALLAEHKCVRVYVLQSKTPWCCVVAGADIFVSIRYVSSHCANSLFCVVICTCVLCMLSRCAFYLLVARALERIRPRPLQCCARCSPRDYACSSSKPLHKTPHRKPKTSMPLNWMQDSEGEPAATVSSALD